MQSHGRKRGECYLSTTGGADPPILRANYLQQKHKQEKSDRNTQSGTGQRLTLGFGEHENHGRTKLEYLGSGVPTARSELLLYVFLESRPPLNPSRESLTSTARSMGLFLLDVVDLIARLRTGHYYRPRMNGKTNTFGS